MIPHDSNCCRAHNNITLLYMTYSFPSNKNDEEMVVQSSVYKVYMVTETSLLYLNYSTVIIVKAHYNTDNGVIIDIKDGWEGGESVSYRLNVPYLEKDDAKALGARWNPVRKFWYCEELTDGLRRWYRGEEPRNEGNAAALGGDEQQAEEERAAGIRNTGDWTGEVRTVGICGDGRQIGEERAAGIRSTGSRTGEERASEIRSAGWQTGEDVVAGLREDESYAQYKTVSQINNLIHETYNTTVEFHNVMVKGEVTNFNENDYRGGTYYFAIKDESALLSCLMWESTARSALHFQLKRGDKVAIIGNLNYYQASGKTQLKVREIANIGDGAALLAYMQLRARLEAEGLFDAAHKKPIPKYPKTIGVITSKKGQAIKDICKTAKERNPYVQLVLYHVNVQGVHSVATIVEGIQYMDQRGFDTIIVGRGGGSDEELITYNHELVARAVYDARTPIISAVGHEGHWTLIDDVADYRESTPSLAAVKAIPDVMTDVNRVMQLRKSMEVNINNQLEQRKLLLSAKMATLEKNSPERWVKSRLDRLLVLVAEMEKNSPRRRVKERQDRLAVLVAVLQKNSPEQTIKERKDRLNVLSDYLRENMHKAVDMRKHRYDILVANLHGLSPTAKLVGGFGHISHDDKPVTSVGDVKEGDSVLIRIHDGEIHSKVTRVTGKI